MKRQRPSINPQRSVGSSNGSGVSKEMGRCLRATRLSVERTETSSNLPSLTLWGHLPEGVHDSTMPEVAIRFANAPSRKRLWLGATKFLKIAAASGGFSHAYLAGGFISAKLDPKDIDLILQPREPYGSKAFKAMEPLFVMGLDTIYKKFAVHLHFWCDAPPQNTYDFREFFQSLRPSDALAGGVATQTRRGMVRIGL